MQIRWYHSFMVEMEKNNIEQQKEKTPKQRVKDVLKRIHFDKIRHLSEEQAEMSRKVTSILYDALDLPDLNRWSVALRDEYPKGTMVTLVGEKDGQLLKPIDVPLNRPEIFLKMYESYLETGEVPEDLVADNTEEEVAEDEEDAEMQERDYSDDIKEYHDLINAAANVEKLIRIQKITKQEFGVRELKKFGIAQALDKKAEQIIFDEIMAGTTDKLQLALAHLDTYKFYEASIGENLRTLLESQTSTEEIPQMPSNARSFERDAAGAETIAELAEIAKKAEENKEATGVLKSIDNLAKTKFTEECKKATGIDQFKSMLGEARRFPFHESTYGENVRHIIEGHAKFFILAEISKQNTIDALNAFEDSIHTMHFSNDSMLTDINNEFVIAREKLRGNEISAQALSGQDLYKQNRRETVNWLDGIIKRYFNGQ